MLAMPWELFAHVKCNSICVRCIQCNAQKTLLEKLADKPRPVLVMPFCLHAQNYQHATLPLF